MGPGRHAEHAEQDPTPRRVLGLFLDGRIAPVVPTVTASLAHDGGTCRCNAVDANDESS